ncbi:type IX secretion system membrane protein PorP/SprF [Bacteroidales bacterium OttesenSCG-928-A17]|nr:type IX secretion system membrane protein PorP/SprF [Bacteroidales bacterium OttesenSCG-928-A17]
MKKVLFIICAFCLTYSGLYAQFDTQISNYWANPSFYNPAYAGQSGNLEAGVMSRMQWLGIEDAPKTTIITAEMPFEFLGKVHGVGFSMYNDKFGLFSSSVLSAQYAWKKKLFKGNLSLGVQMGYIDQSFDGTKIDIPESDAHDKADESAPTSEVSGKAIDAALGIYYARGKWYAGISVTHLFTSELELSEQYLIEIPRSYYFTAGYNIQLSNPLIELRPSILVKTMEMSSLYVEPDSLVEKIEENMAKAMLRNTQIDVSLRMIYNKKFMGGLSWRKGDAVILSLGAKFGMIEVGYAYDFPTSRIIKESTGSHELYAKCVIDLNKRNKKRNKYKSIRIL